MKIRMCLIVEGDAAEIRNKAQQFIDALSVTSKVDLATLEKIEPPTKLTITPKQP